MFFNMRFLVGRHNSVNVPVVGRIDEYLVLLYIVENSSPSMINHGQDLKMQPGGREHPLGGPQSFFSAFSDMMWFCWCHKTVTSSWH